MDDFNVRRRNGSRLTCFRQDVNKSPLSDPATEIELFKQYYDTYDNARLISVQVFMTRDLP